MGVPKRIQYVKHLDKPINFKAALNVAKDETSLESLFHEFTTRRKIEK